jgi:hypothetical protein
VYVCLCEREREKRHTQKKRSGIHRKIYTNTHIEIYKPRNRYTNTHIEIYKPRKRETNTEEDRYERRQRDRDTERKHLNGYR